MVLAPFDPSNKYFHHDIIYEDTAISLGIIDKIEGNPWFVKYRATLKDGSIIVYYKINYINGRYPWGEESFHDIIKGFIKEAENNVLFIYNPDDFNKCVDQIKEFLEDCKAKGIDSEFIENGIYVVNAFEVGEGMIYKETSNYDAHDIEKYNAQKDILKMLEDMLET